MAKCDALVRAYIDALGARALLIYAGPQGRPARISFSTNSNLDLFAELWFSKLQHAELVLMAVQKDIQAIGAARPEGWIDLSAREVRDYIVNVAAGLGATWRTAAEVEAGARTAVEEIVARVEASRQAGGLAKVNAAYKLYRRQQIEKGEAAVSYSAHLAAFTRSLVLLAAVNADGF